MDGDVVLAAGGDRAAYARLIDRTRGAVCSIALAVVRDVVASEDVAQDVYLAAWQELPRLRNPSSFLPWLRQLTRNRAHDAIRRGIRRRALPEQSLAAVADPRPDAGAQLVAEEERAALQAALDELPDDAREVLTLFYREGRSVAQVAALLGLGEPAVKKRLQRARDGLRAATLERLGETLQKTAPSAALTAAVLGAIATAAPGTATAATMAKAGAIGAGLWPKLLAAVGGAAFGAVAGSFGVLGGIARIKRKARDDEERRALDRFARVNVIITCVAALAMPLGDKLWPGGLGLALAFGAFWVTLARNYLVWLPRITARREAAERAEDAQAARRQRRERWTSVLMILLGGAAGWGTVLWVIWHLHRR